MAVHLMKTLRIVLAVCLASTASAGYTASYTIVDTGQTGCYDNQGSMACPGEGAVFAGQDGAYTRNAPSYTDNGDGTVTDNNTGLMWQQDQGSQVTYDQAVAGASAQATGGYTDWRLPTVKELYSLLLFSGQDPSALTGNDTSGIRPFIDTDYFGFAYGDTAAGDRIIDVQYVSATRYVSTTMNSSDTVFGVNFADGRIKGYPTRNKRFYVKYVRGNSAAYGVNQFSDNGDGTITDTATGLMWMQADAGPLTWEAALDYAEGASHAGYTDWRLPNAKELQSIVDYTRSPAATGSAAIDPLFTVTPITDEGGGLNFPFYWTGTTHLSHQAAGREGGSAVYIAFGDALGWMQDPRTGTYALMDVHGAGAQRSDPKTGNAADYPFGHGPQGDVIRIRNQVRLVRTADLQDACTGLAHSVIQGFDRAYYLAAKLAQLQAGSGQWAGKTTADLEVLLQAYGMTAEDHYTRHGHAEGLAPNAWFNPEEYIAAKAGAIYQAGGYASLEAARAFFLAAWPKDVYFHYLEYGAAEGLNPSSRFDEAAYLAQKLANLQAGSREWAGRSVADLRAYLSQIGMTALSHYLYHGICEGLTPVSVQ